MSNFIKAMDDLPWLAKILLCLPLLHIVWSVYRIVKGIDQKNTLTLVVGILCIIPGIFFAWLIDMICTILNKRPTLFA